MKNAKSPMFSLQKYHVPCQNDVKFFYMPAAQVLGNSTCMFLVSQPLETSTMLCVERLIQLPLTSQVLNPYLYTDKMGGGPLLEVGVY